MTRLAAPAGILVGGQDCHPAASGAHTGDISAASARRCGRQPRHRRPFRAPGRPRRNRRAGAAEGAGGAGGGPRADRLRRRTRAEREAGQAEAVVARQLAQSVPDDAATRDVVVAYEPVWAIGTGLTPTAGDIAAMHGALRAQVRGALRRGGRGHPAALWRLAETGQCPRDSGGAGGQWRPRGRRQPLGGRPVRHYLGGVRARRGQTIGASGWHLLRLACMTRPDFDTKARP